MTNENASSSNPSGSGEERVRKVYVRDLREKERVRTVFRVSRKARLTARSGKPFLTLTFTDKTGHVDGRVFERVEELEPTFLAGDYVLVTGTVTSFHGKAQVVAESLERLDPGPIDAAEFTAAEPPPEPAGRPERAEKREERREEKREERPREERAREERAEAPAGAEGGRGAAGAVREMAERVGDTHLRALLLAFLDDAALAEALRQAPGARGGPRAWRGGVAESVASAMRLVLRLADHYPQADRDLALAGAFLQGVMRAREVGGEKGSPFSDEGRLVGAAVMAAQMLREKVRTLPDFPALLEQHLTHIVLAAHEARPALSVEAELVRAAVALDTRLSGWLEAMGRDTHETWTEPLKADGRTLWKGALPTQRGRSPVEGRRRKEKKPRAEKAAAPQAEGREPREGRKEEAAAPARPPRPPRELPSELSFKPFSALMAIAGEQPEGQKPEGGEGTPSGEAPKSE